MMKTPCLLLQYEQTDSHVRNICKKLNLMYEVQEEK